MRILVVTDSLGSPRDCIEPDVTWTEKLLLKYGSQCTIYIKCIPGLSARDINIWYIKYLKPDILIMQFGVVDACRRALKRAEIKLLSLFPHLSKIVHQYIKRHHYYITRIRGIHHVGEEEFGKKVEEIESISNCEKVFIEIAPPGENLINMTYNVKSDIARYNKILEMKGRGHLLKVYNDSFDKYLLEDGHHLNAEGHDLIFRFVSERIDCFLKNDCNSPSGD